MKLFILVCAAVLALPGPASALMLQDLACGPAGAVVASVERMGEHLTATFSLPHAGGGFSVYTSDAGKWSLVLSAPGGLECLMAFGTGYKINDPGI